MTINWRKIIKMGKRSDMRAALDECDLGWKSIPEKPVNKRFYTRIQAADLSALFNTKGIIVKIKTFNATFSDYLLDLGEGGVAVNLPTLLPENLPIRVEFSLGKKKIISSANVRQTRIIGQHCITGMKFIELAEKSAEYIGGSICIHGLLNSMDVEVLPDFLFYGDEINADFLGKRDGQTM